MVEQAPTPTLEYAAPAVSPRPRVWAIVLALLLPTALDAAYLTLTRWSPSSPFNGDADWIPWVDWAEMIGAVGLGSAILSRSRFSREVRTGALILYWPVQTVWLLWYGIAGWL